MVKLTREALQELPHLNFESLNGRSVFLSPVWNGENWRLWVPDAKGNLLELKVEDVGDNVYLSSAGAACANDLYLEFIQLAHQKVCFPEINSVVKSACERICDLAVNAQAVSLLSTQSAKDGDFSWSKHAVLHIESIMIRCRSLLDIVYEMFRGIWCARVRLLDQDYENLRKSRQPPRKLSKLVLNADKERTSEEMQGLFAFPPTIASSFALLGKTLSRNRTIRDRIVHGTGASGHVFITEKGLMVSDTDWPYNQFQWADHHRYNENLVSLKPWIANEIQETMQACTAIIHSLASCVDFGPDVFPNHVAFVRSSQSAELLDLLSAVSMDQGSAVNSAFWPT
jgi:hypothetical protein